MKHTILRRHDVEARTGLSRSGIYKLIGEVQFPKSIKLTSKAVGWLEADIDDWIEARIRATAA